jgi:hypothetical protein
VTWPIGAVPIGGRLELTPWSRRTGTVFCEVQAQGASTDFPSMQLLDRLFRLVLGCESDEGKTPGPAGLAVLRNMNVYDFPNLSEQLPKLIVCRCEVEVPYEYLA